MLFDINLLKDSKESVDQFLKTQQQYEKEGRFNENVDGASYEGALPVTEEFEFIKKGFKNWVLHKVYLAILKTYTKRINKQLTNVKIEGKENLKGIKACIATCNHISKVDSFAVRQAIGYDINYVAADYNNWNNILGTVGRHTGYLPLSPSLDRKLMRKFNEAIEYYLTKKKRKILFYPEQAMWREESRPRPLKDGAFHYAVKHNVPILPLFITFTPKENMVDDQGRYEFSDYTIHILPPIYPKENVNNRENVEYMRNTNYQMWKDCYEKTYNKKLEFKVKSK